MRITIIPNSQSRGSGDANRILTITLLLASALPSASCSKANSGKAANVSAPPPVSARVAAVDLKQIRRNIESVGSLFAFEEVTVSSEVEGKVEEILADVGDLVSKGQPVVKVSPVELQLSLEQQRAAMQQARARLGLTGEIEDLKDVRDAAEVKKAVADLNDAEQKYRRAKSLYEEGLVPRQSFDEVEARYKAARANFELAVQAVENLRAQLAQYRASMALAQKKVTDTVIRAPFSGQLKERLVAPGQYLKVQTPVVVIVNPDPMRVRLKVPERMAGWIRSGQEVSVAVEAYPDRTFSGKISRINPSVDQQTRSFEIEALITNRDRMLKPGFFVKASIPSDKIEGALVVPQEALQYSYGVYKVFLLEGNVVHEREVRPGHQSNGMVEIIEGLAQNERIALPAKGQELKDGAVIEIAH